LGIPPTAGNITGINQEQDMAIITHALGNRPNFFGGMVQSDDEWLNALPVNVVRAPGKKYGRTTDGVWVSAGASYGAQVEFKSFDGAKAFIAANSSSTRLASGTTHPRVVCDTVQVFVAAYLTVVGKAQVTEAPAPVKTTTAALVDVNLALALEEVEEEEAKAVSPRDAAIASIKAARPDRAEDEAFIAKVLSRMGL
jgi:hypothetical protein